MDIRSKQYITNHPISQDMCLSLEAQPDLPIYAVLTSLDLIVMNVSIL